MSKEYDREISIRRRDGSYFKVTAPEWHDEKSRFSNDGAPGLLPNIYIVHPFHESMKLNTKTRQFESCDQSTVPPVPEGMKIR